MKNEIWKSYPNFGKGRYLVSTFGRVKVVYKNGKTKILKNNITPFGYRRIQLYSVINGKEVFKNIFVHRLVAITFIPNPQKKKFVNHINSNRKDCRVDNLEWVTRSENIKHAFLNGRLSRVGVKNSRAKLTEKQVLEIFKMEGSLSQIGRKYNLGTSAVHRIKNGVSWSHIKR